MSPLPARSPSAPRGVRAAPGARTPRAARALLLLAATLLAGAAAAQGVAQGVALAGRMGDKALLVIDGRTRVVAPGQSVDGTRLLRWDGDTAWVDHRGTPTPLRPTVASTRPPAAPAAARAFAAREVVIPAGAGGHHVTDGAINGRTVRFMVDTGATLVSLGKAEAERLGVDLRQARPAEAQTAGGRVQVQLVTLATLRVGEVELTDVAAVVTPVTMPYVLLGNSALERFQLRRDNDVMRLELR